VTVSGVQLGGHESGLVLVIPEYACGLGFGHHGEKEKHNSESESCMKPNRTANGNVREQKRQNSNPVTTEVRAQ
jgi:hypothetical protein